MKKITYLTLVIISALWTCNKDESPPKNFVEGKNRFLTLVDGDEREYYVHVPQSYDGNDEVPLVLMLHGGSGTGLITYNSSGWKEVGEEENLITVFPTAWSYCWIRANGSRNDTTRWNSLPGIFEFCPGEVPRDDVKFLRRIVDEVNDLFDIDQSRIYMAGFSSGAQMSFRCAIEMDDILAAIFQSGGSHQKETMLRPDRNMPIAVEIGSSDDTWFDNDQFPPLVLFEELLNNYNPFRNVIESHVRVFDYGINYTILEGSALEAISIFPSIPDTDHREFRFSLVEGLDHSYPNSVNHPLHGARIHWDWMKQFTFK